MESHKQFVFSCIVRKNIFVLECLSTSHDVELKFLFEEEQKKVIEEPRDQNFTRITTKK